MPLGWTRLCGFGDLGVFLIFCLKRGNGVERERERERVVNEGLIRLQKPSRFFQLGFFADFELWIVNTKSVSLLLERLDFRVCFIDE